MKLKSPRINLLIVDDHPMVREGLKSLLGRDERFDITGEAASSAEAVDCLQNALADVVLMDIRMPGEDGIDACKRIKELFPGVKVIMLTSYLEDSMVLGAVQAGADGYLLKEVDAQVLVDSILKVAQGHPVLPENVTGSLLHGLRQDTGEGQFGQRKELISPQEGRVMALVAEGLINKEIADQMNLSEKTVKNYLASIFVKLDVSRRAQVASFYTKYMQEP